MQSCCSAILSYQWSTPSPGASWIRGWRRPPSLQNQLQENQVTTCLVICIYMCVCECVSVHVCVKTYRHITIYICICTDINWNHWNTCVYMFCVYIYLNMNIIYICASNMCMYIYIYIVDRYMSICSNMYKHTHIRIHIYM